MLLAAEGIALLGLAVALAGPVPAALARAAWPVRSPRAALVLWQAIGLGGGLAILGAGITLAVSGLHRSWLAGIGALPGAVAAGPHGGPGVGPGPLGWAGVVLTVAAGAWLGVVAVTCAVRLTLARREHRRRLDLLADELALADLLAGPGRAPAPAAASPPGPGDRAGVRVRLLEHPATAAYCLPGMRPRIVVSRGVLDALSRAELTAVVAHEKAHAQGRHDLVIQPFRAWVATFPFLPAGRAALTAVELLVELTADNAVSRAGQRAALEAALRRLAGSGDKPGGPEDGHRQAADRARRLARPPRPLSRLVAGAVCAAALTLVLLPPAILIAS